MLSKMNKFYFFSLLFALLGMFISCDQKRKTNEKAEDFVEEQETDSDIALHLQKMESIDSLAENELTVVRSLRWEKSTSSFTDAFEVTAYVNEDGDPLKVEEQFSLGSKGHDGVRTFYLENNEIIAARDQYEEWIDSTTAMYVEEEHFLEDEKPFLRRTRRADYYELIDKEQWKTIRTTEVSMDRALRLIRGEEEFKTHFIGTINANGAIFLLLGEPKEENRFVTTVRADRNAPFIRQLMRNKDDYKFKPIRIQFDVISNPGSPTFRVLRNAAWE